jgi:RND family efflux transporter MFP subunit
MKQITGCMVLAILALTGCRQEPEKKETAERAVSVEVYTVDSVAYKIPVRASGMLAARKEMKLSFKTGGLIREIPVEEAATVKEGQVLASLDLSEIRARVKQASVALEKAKRDLERAGNLYRDSVATLEQYQNARSAFELARSQKQIADFNLRHSIIKAPTDGKVLKILAEVNEITGPGHPVLLFASTAGDWVVRVPLTDKDIVKLTLGDSARVTMDAFPDEVFRAEISELGVIADPVTGTYEAELLVLTGKPRFRTGFIARAELFPAETGHGCYVPLEALLDASDDRADVFIVEDGRATRRGIRTGILMGGGIVVREGLKGGELVVTRGAAYLEEDTKVQVVHTQKGTGQ